MGLVEDLRQALYSSGGPAGSERVLVVGVGNPARGDDGAGPAVAEELRGAGVEALDAGDAPERYLGPIAESGAGAVLFVDAVDFGGGAGEAVLLQEHELSGRSCVTHRSSLALVMRYLREQAGQRSLVIGVQPRSTRFGDELTPQVAGAVRGITAAIRAVLVPTPAACGQSPHEAGTRAEVRGCSQS